MEIIWLNTKSQEVKWIFMQSIKDLSSHYDFIIRIFRMRMIFKTIWSYMAILKL